MTARRLLRGLAVVVAAIGLVLAFAEATGAHAYLQRSTPSDGERLDHAPTEVTLVFSERPDPSLSSVAVLNAAGAEVQSGRATNVPGETLALRVALPDLPDGVYTVSWQVVSQVDGHQTSGTFAFGVGETPPPTRTGQQATARPPTPLGVAGRAVLLMGLCVLFAIGFDGLVIYRGEPPARRPLALAGAAAALLGTVAIVLAERSALDVSLGTLLRSNTGTPLEWLAGGTIAAAAAAAIVAVRSGRARLIALAALAGLAMLARVRGGHAAAGGAAWLEQGLQWVHVLAVGAWIGGLVLLVLWLRLGDQAEGGRVAHRFSWLAGISLGMVAVTGVLRSSHELGWTWWLHPFRNGYGTTLALKIVVALALIALGTFNHFRSVPRVRAGRPEGPPLLRRVAQGELALAVGVFALTGTLTGLAPRNAPASAASAPIVVTGSDFATTTRARLTVSPGTAGQNTFDLKLADFDTGAPAQADAVTLSFRFADSTLSSTTLDLSRAETGEWTGQGSQLSIDGMWNVTVLARQGTQTLEIDLHLTTRPPEQTVAVSSGSPPITTLTVPSGESIQAYNDPGTGGANEFHLTAFDDDGKELPLASVSVTASGPQTPPTALKLRRLSAGHFVGDVSLTAGEWHFDLLATGENGDTIHVVLDQTIPG
ncbi:MAG TPA: copper resistance protein CopC [Actinomycetota bacterium]